VWQAQQNQFTALDRRRAEAERRVQGLARELEQTQVLVWNRDQELAEVRQRLAESLARTAYLETQLARLQRDTHTATPPPAVSSTNAPRPSDDPELRPVVLADFAMCVDTRTYHRHIELLEQAATPTALARWRRAASNGVAEAQFLWGECSEHGIGGPVDLTAAMRAYQHSGEGGLAWGDAALGQHLRRGSGGRTNLTEAVRRFEKAAQTGLPFAQAELGSCYLDGLGVERDEARGFGWIQKAADQGLVMAEYLVGLCHQRGQGTPVSVPLAREWFRKAAKQGSKAAAEALSELEATLSRTDGSTPNPRPRTRTLDLGGRSTLELVWIPPGDFALGSTAAERAWAAGPEGKGRALDWFDEGADPRRVHIHDGFWMGRTEVTVAQWRRFIAENQRYLTSAEEAGQAWVFDRGRQVPREARLPGGPDQRIERRWDTVGMGWKDIAGKSWRDPNHGFPLREDHPVTCLSWDDTVAFCEWVTRRLAAHPALDAGSVCRLPSEAEWEYACRGGRVGTRFWWGDEAGDARERCNGPSQDPIRIGTTNYFWTAVFPWTDGHAFVAPVNTYGEKGLNGYGLADMLGNVFEWCLDHAHPAGVQPEVFRGNPDFRMARGGSFFSNPGQLRCAARRRAPPTAASSDVGFRVVLGKPR
jgi:formylglycine-generating enzyme required for sulfatase activity